MSRAANAPNPIPLDTASYPAAAGTPLMTADDWFAACTSAFLRGLAVAAPSSAPLPRRAPPGSPAPARVARVARSASPTADDAETAEGAHEAETQAHTAAAVR